MPSCWSEPAPRDAYILSWISVILTLAAASGGITLFAMTGSDLALVFGLENCVDFLSSAVVLWRFDLGTNKDPDGSATAAMAQQQILQKREKRASMAISLVLIFLGLGVFAAASDDLAKGQAEPKYELDDVIVISIFSTFIFGTLCIFKFHYADKLQSASLYKDGICSLIGTILAIALLINTLIIEQDNGVWWLDPLVALICGFASFLYGALGWIQAVQQGIPVFTVAWWTTSQGDGMDEMTGRELNNADTMTTTGKPAASRSSTLPANDDLDLQENDVEMSTNPSGAGDAGENEVPPQVSEVV
mmetsp:Transcript_24723/g.69404  ORF Transcript_24723/g.69404 Transcript_24723/m.69404 type:complete len:304 (-) Transcript_24723:145-1056(-)|eukprot:CAMPEP_0119560920 /NCGR_PEP_ID=MMETSP1352-20130426/16196_1 /TAXON_ID=265584 /ORGANISM="Stauroneis constricta, Strain CCMP1120" /LENGTH=303 /DNA_ID=CAMNT_0007608997 /DNA_START=183 /DNA_END=1094 /DNA_ORIENTATION=-